MATPRTQKASEELLAGADAGAGASPLMANKKAGDDDVAPRRDSLREKREKREKRRQERDEHIAQLDSAMSLDAGATRHTTSQPQVGRKGDGAMSLEAGMARQTTSQPQISRKGRKGEGARSGRRRDWGARLVTLVHVFDALLGVAALVYGGLLATAGFDAPATEAAIAILVYGSVVLFSSLAGMFSWYRPHQRRVGLLIGAYSAPVIALFYVVSMVAPILDYATTRGDVLYLNEAAIAALTQMKPLLMVALAALTAIEIGR